MEIKDFIIEAITQISLGVKEMQSKESELGIIINPSLQIGSNDKRYVPKAGTGHYASERYIQDIKFEIGVVVTNDQTGGGGLGVSIPVFNIGANMNVKNSEENVNKLSFSIPICLPTTNVELKDDSQEVNY